MQAGTFFLYPNLVLYIRKEKFYSMENNNENQLNIELSEEVAEGIYSNLAIITHSNAEFVVDFVKVMPGVPKARVKSRIVLTPQHEIGRAHV